MSTLFLKGALQKAEDERTRESVEFRAKQLHQKPEIAKIEILAAREEEVLVSRSQQVRIAKRKRRLARAGAN